MGINEEQEKLLNAYEQELLMQQSQPQSYNPYASSTMFGGQQKQNLIEWELDFKPELEEIERLLRCDIIAKDKEGNEIWVENPDKSKVFLNELGVNDVLRKIRLLVNKNKVLSNYNIEEIRMRVRMIENEIRILIYNNYEQYGIDNEYKMNNYSMIVLSIGSLIEDCYRRAMGGEGHKGLNEQRIVQQNEQVMPQGMRGGMYPSMNMSGKKESRWYAPWSWGK